MERTVRQQLAVFAFVLFSLPLWAQDTTPAGASQPVQQESIESKSGTDEAKKPKADHDKPLPSAEIRNPVLWEDPGDIAGRNLFYGQGGAQHQPKPPFQFMAEDPGGSNPKFDVRDAEDKKWRVKLGEEAKPEVVASRLLWAVGYFANDDYLLHVATVEKLDLARGGNRVKSEKTGSGKVGQVIDARFARKPGGQDKIAVWTWKENPFSGKRELNGLRVMMAVMNNWDLKDENNAVYFDKKGDRQIFLASDVGAAFGTNGLSWTKARSKGNIESFKGSKFITRTTDTEVDFGTPHPPTGILVASFGTSVIPFANRAALDWIGKNVPREDARWMGSLLGQLTHEQLMDAFRAGNFPADQIEAYVDVVEGRIAELKKL